MNPARKRVLLVEDNLENRYLATFLLESDGFEVHPAVSGTEALAAFAPGKFDLVLLDLQLPDIDGFELARRMRQTSTAEQLPIIAVSAFAMVSDRKKAFAAGCTGYLEKPIDAESFTAQVMCQAGVPNA
jgi:two-component system, cell cycle response regulator DivK